MKTSGMCLAVCLVALVAFAPEAAAEPYDAFTSTITAGTMGNGRGRQTLREFVLGLDFEVMFDRGITISQLGLWDDNGNGLVSPHSLMVYDLADTSAPLASIDTLPGGGVLRDGYRYFDLTEAIMLPGGTQFSVVAYYPPSNADSNGNSGPTPPSLGEPAPIFNGNGYVDNVGQARYGRGLYFPDSLDTGPANRYHSVSFSYTPNPEPGTLLLLSGALAAAGAWRRRRSRQR